LWLYETYPVLLVVAVLRRDQVVVPLRRKYNCTGAPGIAAPVSTRVNRPITDTAPPYVNAVMLLLMDTDVPRSVTVLGLLTLPDRSRTHTRNVYVVPSTSPLTVMLERVPAYTASPTASYR
jgi:hypothetical protein